MLCEDETGICTEVNQPKVDLAMSLNRPVDSELKSKGHSGPDSRLANTVVDHHQNEFQQTDRGDQMDHQDVEPREISDETLISKTRHTSAATPIETTKELDDDPAMLSSSNSATEPVVNRETENIESITDDEAKEKQGTRVVETKSKEEQHGFSRKKSIEKDIKVHQETEERTPSLADFPHPQKKESNTDEEHALEWTKRAYQIWSQAQATIHSCLLCFSQTGGTMIQYLKDVSLRVYNTCIQHYDQITLALNDQDSRAMSEVRKILLYIKAISVFGTIIASVYAYFYLVSTLSTVLMAEWDVGSPSSSMGSKVPMILFLVASIATTIGFSSAVGFWIQFWTCTVFAFAFYYWTGNVIETF